MYASFQFLFLSEVLQWRAQTTPDHILYTLLNCRVRPPCGAPATPARRFPSSCPVTPHPPPHPWATAAPVTKPGSGRVFTETFAWEEALLSRRVYTSIRACTCMRAFNSFFAVFSPKNEQ